MTDATKSALRCVTAQARQWAIPFVTSTQLITNLKTINIMYTTTDKARTFSGEIETDNMNDLVLVDELTCEDLPFKVVKRDLNSDMLFCSLKTLTEAINILNQD